MKKLKWIFLTIFALQFVTGQAQNQNSKQPAGQTQGANSSGVNSNGQAPPSDTTSQAAGDNNNSSQNGAQETNAGAQGSQDERVSNVPAVPQTTSSGSGSPAVLSGDNGKNRDGTNNVQRASMNMVGSPAGSIDLAEHSVTPDAEIKERQRAQQSNQTSIQQQSNKTSNMPGNAPGGEDRDINDNNRKENNALSDQNKSSKAAAQKAKPDEDGKKEEKLKRKKNKE